MFLVDVICLYNNDVNPSNSVYYSELLMMQTGSEEVIQDGSCRGRTEWPLMIVQTESLKKALLSHTSPSLSAGTLVCEEFGSLLSHDCFSSDLSAVVR